MKKIDSLLYILIPILLISPLLLFSLPLITLGTDDLMMIKHFNADEAVLVKLAGKIYSNGLAPVEDNASTPQFFNYVAGCFLFPFTFFKGVNYQVITIGLRALDLFSALITTILIYLLCLKFFRSIMIGIFASLLFSTTPAYLFTLFSCRPHPLEILFILIGFYFCFSALRASNRKSFIWAILFISLATATKFGGIFMIPSLTVVYLYLIWQSQSNDSSRLTNKHNKLFYMLSTLIMLCAIFIPFIATRLYLMFPKKFLVYSINSFYEFIASRNFRLLLLIALLIFFYGLLWLIINFISARLLARRNKTVSRVKYFFIVNRIFLFIFCVIILNMTVLFILNPGYFLFPKETLKYFIRIQLAKTIMGTGLNPGLNKSLLDLNATTWLKMLFGDFLLNAWLGALFFCYFLFEVLFLKKNWKNSRVFLLQKFLIWLYCLILLCSLVIFVSHRTQHYLLPISLLMGILISYAAVEIPRQFKSKLIRRSTFLILTLILAMGLSQRTRLIIDYFNVKSGYNNKEAGILIGKWLENNFDIDSRVYLDSEYFYIPPSFNNVSFMGEDGQDIDAFLYNINTAGSNPDILVITNFCDPFLRNAIKINAAIESGKLKNYRLIQSFDYSGPYEKNKIYKKIFIYSKI